MVRLKAVTYAKISPLMVNPRDIAGERIKEEEEEEEIVTSSLSLACRQMARYYLVLFF